MKTARRIFKQLRNTALRHRDDERLRAEVEDHIALQTAENLRAGLSPMDARRQAVLKFGAVESVKEEYRDQRGIPLLETLIQDIRFGLRQLRENPGLTLTVVREGAALACIGSGVGFIGAYFVGRTMQSALFGVGALDFSAFAVVGLILLLTALLACYLPGRRAAGLDPMQALRGD
jgi:hypothetical protein